MDTQTQGYTWTLDDIPADILEPPKPGGGEWVLVITNTDMFTVEVFGPFETSCQANRALATWFDNKLREDGEDPLDYPLKDVDGVSEYLGDIWHYSSMARIEKVQAPTP